MDRLGFDNPAFVAYAVAAALTVLKVMGQGWMTVARMIRTDAGLLNREDLRKTPMNPNPRPEQLEPEETVERSRRLHRNDLENIPAFWAAGLLFVLTAPPAWLAWVLCLGFAAARLAHSWAYLTAQNHEVRATFYTIGSVIVIVMALWVLVAALI